MNRLLERLDDIGKSLKNSGHALALLGLGSVGLSIGRLDEFSDLDFFVICEKSFKDRYLNDLDWLSSIRPVAYSFRNSPDGYKLLFSDNIFCEYAIFESDELKNIPFSKGRIVWKKGDFDEHICEPVVKEMPKAKNIDFLLGEALTNIYVGLGRYHRGEKLSGYKFIQEYAFSRVLEIMTLLEKPKDIEEDCYSVSRRFEFRYPHQAGKISRMLLGYERTLESAMKILTFLDDNFAINQEMKKRILDLINKK
jgi:hypothetical protein